MRIRLILSVWVGCLSFCASGFAYDNYIPLGAGYATGKNVLPPLNSDEQAFTAQTDIYEAEIYRKQLEERRNQSYLNHFSNSINSSEYDYNVDY